MSNPILQKKLRLFLQLPLELRKARAMSQDYYCKLYYKVVEHGALLPFIPGSQCRYWHFDTKFPPILGVIIGGTK